MSLEKQLAEACQITGKEIPLWTQANGSNLSLKESGRLLVKGSGFRLDAVKSDRGIAKINLVELEKRLWEGSLLSDEEYFTFLKAAAKQEKSFFQPSMESGFHAVLRKKWVLHLHSLVGILLAESDYDEPRRKLSQEFGERIVVVPEVAPGLALAKLLVSMPEANIYLLKNHGIILQTNDRPDLEKGILALWKEIERKFCSLLGHCALKEKVLQGKPASLPQNWKLKNYFPDAVVFGDRIKALVGTQIIDDPDAYEIALATHLLYEACPTLPELDESRVCQILGMSAEKHRQEAGK